MARRMNGIGTWLALATKGTKLVTILKTTKLLKLLISLSSMLLSIAAYGLTMGWWFGIGLVLMLFIHEMGHVIALHRKHLPSSLPVFIPFLGAAIFAPNFGDRDTEAYVGYGGPLLGSMAALACFALWAVTGATSNLLLVISYLGVYINLFNLIPISPLDGGRIMQAVGSGFRYLGAGLALVLVIYSRQPGMIVILIFILQDMHLPLWWRPTLAALFCGIMSGLFLTGFGIEFWIDLADATLGASFIALYVYADTRRRQAMVQGWVDATLLDDPRPMPARSVRLFWLAAYGGLAVVLGATIAVQGTYLAAIAARPS